MDGDGLGSSHQLVSVIRVRRLFPWPVASASRDF